MAGGRSVWPVTRSIGCGNPCRTAGKQGVAFVDYVDIASCLGCAQRIDLVDAGIGRLDLATDFCIAVCCNGHQTVTDKVVTLIICKSGFQQQMQMEFQSIDPWQCLNKSGGGPEHTD